MKRTGEILKKAREEKGLSLHEIGLSLKISSKVLKAIEEGDDSQLPAKTFLRGFVQSYANYLHLDPNYVLEIFYQEMGSTRPKPYIRTNENDRPPSKEDLAAEAPPELPLKSPVPTTASEDSSKEAVVTPIRKKSSVSDRENLKSLGKPKSTKTIVISVIGVLLVGLIIFTKKMIDKYSKEAEVPTSEISQTMEGTTPVDDGPPSPDVLDETPATAAAVEPKAVADATPITPISTKPSPTPATQSTPLPSPTSTAMTSSTPKPTPTPSPTMTPSASASAAPSPVATPNPTGTVAASPSPTATPTATPTPKPESPKPVELIVEALDTVEIEYASPSGKPQRIKLSAEQLHTFKSRSGLKINFSNGGAVNLILNGKDIGIPGDLGKPIKLSY